MFIRMDDYLDKKTLGEYIAEYQHFKRDLEFQKKREDERIKRFYGNHKTRRKSSFDEYKEFYSITPSQKIAFIDEETPESLQENLKNRELYPTLESKEDSSSKVLTGIDVKNNILEMEEKRIKEKMEKQREKREQENIYMGEEYLEEEEESNKCSITIVRQQKKKKKGGKR